MTAAGLPASATSTSRFLTVPAFAAVFGACALVSQWLSIETSTFATFWVPSGLYLAALVRADRAQWPFLIVGAMIGNVGTDVVVASRAWLPALGFAAVNTIEAVTGAWLLRAIGGVPHPRSHRLRVAAGHGRRAGVGSAGWTARSPAGDIVLRRRVISDDVAGLVGGGRRGHAHHRAGAARLRGRNGRHGSAWCADGAPQRRCWPK